MANKNLKSIKFPNLPDTYIIPQGTVTDADLEEAEGTKADAIVLSASGAIASYDDGGDLPMKSLKVNIVPKQSGTGDPSPSNVRAISGTDEVGIDVTGKNLFDKDATDTSNGYESSRYLEYDGGGSNNASYSVSEYIAIKGGANYTLTGISGNAPSICYYDSSKSFISGVKIGSVNPKTITTPSNARYIRFSIYNANLDITQMESGDSSTAYAPYNPDSYSEQIALPSTVYGGTLDVVSGKLSIDRAMVDAGTLNWSKLGTSYITFGSTSLANVIKQNNASATAICSQYKAESSSSASGSADNYVWVNTNKLLAIKDTSKANMTDAEFKTAMNGVQLVYELATPTEIDLTPTEVKSLLGDNNVWSDSGTVEVEYRADTSLVINKILEALEG